MSPRIPEYQRKEIPQVVPLPRADPGAMTQDIGALARMGGALTQTGFAVTEVGMKFQQKLKEAEEVSQFSKASAFLGNSYNEFRRDHDSNLETNWAKTETAYQDWKRKSTAEAEGFITQPNALSAFNRYTTKNDVVWSQTLWDSTNKNRINKAEGDTEYAVLTAEKNLDLVAASMVIASAVNAGILDPKAGEIRKQKALETIEKETKKLNYESVWNKAIAAPDYDSAVKIVKLHGLEANQTKELLLGVKRYFETQEADKKQAASDAVEKWENEALKNLETLQPGNVHVAPKGVNREHWLDKIDKRNKAILNGENDPLKETDFTKYAELSEKCNTAPETIADTEIYSYVGKGKKGGISTADAEKLVGIRKARLSKDKADDPLKTERANRYQGMLKSLKTAKVFSGDDIENEIVYGQKANLLDSYLVAHPDATDKEVEEYFGTLTKEAKVSYVGKLLDIFGMGPMEFFGRGVYDIVKEGGAVAAEGKDMDFETATAILKEAGGDKEKARKIAKQRGYKL